MTVDVWGKISHLAAVIESKFQQTGHVVHTPTHEYDWYNSIYTSDRYRRAHIEVVDRRESHKIYILHCTVFPHIDDPSPIWGFDAVCGPSKITGAFHDFSLPGHPDDPMFTWWQSKSAEYQWHKPRALPEWAAAIFSKSMVAAGNVNTVEELDALCTLATATLDFYLDNVGCIRSGDQRDLQNFYCQQQKLNPHVIRSMVAMGVDDKIIKQFVDQVLFPEV